MTKHIKAVFLDLGNTLRMLVNDEEHMQRARLEITRLVGTNEDPVSFCARLDERYKDYRKWAFAELTEASEEEMWTRWMTPEYPAEHITAVAGELTYQFRQSKGRRVLVDGGREVIEELDRRGYTLGIISNLIGKREIPEWLKADGLESYFKSVMLSSVYGRRKPHPSIYLEAARRAGVEAAECAYVGDNLKRDVTGTRDAGFGMVIIMLTPAELAEADITDENRPDRIIHDFRALLDIFPGPGLAPRD
jgi:HAD superfamily hydrolase (TIGR01662 family)